MTESTKPDARAPRKGNRWSYSIMSAQGIMVPCDGEPDCPFYGEATDPIRHYHEVAKPAPVPAQPPAAITCRSSDAPFSGMVPVSAAPAPQGENTCSTIEKDASVVAVAIGVTRCPECAEQFYAANDQFKAWALGKRSFKFAEAYAAHKTAALERDWNIAKKAFDLEEVTKFPEPAGGLNALQIARKFQDMAEKNAALEEELRKADHDAALLNRLIETQRQEFLILRPKLEQAESEARSLRDALQELRAARTAWHEKNGVPISAEYARFLEAIGVLERLASQPSALPTENGSLPDKEKP